MLNNIIHMRCYRARILLISQKKNVDDSRSQLLVGLSRVGNFPSQIAYEKRFHFLHEAEEP